MFLVALGHMLPSGFPVWRPMCASLSARIYVRQLWSPEVYGLRSHIDASESIWSTVRMASGTQLPPRMLNHTQSTHVSLSSCVPILPPSPVPPSPPYHLSFQPSRPWTAASWTASAYLDMVTAAAPTILPSSCKQNLTGSFLTWRLNKYYFMLVRKTTCKSIASVTIPFRQRNCM